MEVSLINPIDITFKVPPAFLREFLFLQDPIDYKCFHVDLAVDVLNIHIDPISAESRILNGPNGVLKWIALRDGSLPGSVPHDVIWEFAEELAKLLQVPAPKVRMLADFIYCWIVFAYGGRNLWTRLANRFCFKVAFPFGNFLKVHNLPLPNWSAPLVVTLLAPIALWMFLFNREFYKAGLIGGTSIRMIADGKTLTYVPKGRLMRRKF